MPPFYSGETIIATAIYMLVAAGYTIYILGSKKDAPIILLLSSVALCVAIASFASLDLSTAAIAGYATRTAIILLLQRFVYLAAGIIVVLLAFYYKRKD